jgi:hypothetical protein
VIPGAAAPGIRIKKEIGKKWDWYMGIETE